MTLEFEKLTHSIERMGQKAVKQQEIVRQQTMEVEQLLMKHAVDWEGINNAVNQALETIDPKLYRAARPLPEELLPLDTAVPPPVPPEKATIIATDGSQIMPDRHASVLYYLINIGGIVYYHGSSDAPFKFTRPTLNDLQGLSSYQTGSGLVSARRDKAEIEILASMVWDNREQSRPIVALLDQRLLYFPGAGADAERGEVSKAWQESIDKIRHAGGLLAGYIDKPEKNSVVTMLQSLRINEPGFDKVILTDNSPLMVNDRHLFGRILEEGDRSRVFIDVSSYNQQFREKSPENEVCFFYFNPGGGEIARIDIPISVAQDSEAVSQIHALLHDQCRLLGGYPYVLARADEIAVVGKQDQAELNHWLEIVMMREGIETSVTSKQSSKNVARGGKSRHGL